MTITPALEPPRRRARLGLALWLSLTGAGAACSGEPVSDAAGADGTTGCTGRCFEAAPALAVADVETVLAQGIAEAQARSASATIAVVDRVGNVLAVYRMGAAASRPLTIVTRRDGAGAAVIPGGLEGIHLPLPTVSLNLDDQAAIAKAITAAYLCSEGNAFSTRTAGQIIQEHFDPGEELQPAGPLFGVQFSQLACSDLMSSFDGMGPGVGPQRSPLGLSADPGGFPLYRSGTPVGGVGVIADGIYGIDPDITDRDRDLDEAIAYAAAFGFAAPVDRRAERITADGKTLRFSDVDDAQLVSAKGAAPAFASLPAEVGALLPVKGYSDGAIRPGQPFGLPASGIRSDADATFPGQDAFVLVDATNAVRYPPRAGTDAAALGAAVLSDVDVLMLLRSALGVANRARAQIRRPVGSQARVTISVVDTMGQVLGLVSTRDAPIFGIDVSLQKARTAALLSSPSAAAFLSALPPAQYVRTEDLAAARGVSLRDYVVNARAFLGDDGAFADGRIAYSSRAVGNLARPFFPDGIDGQPPGAFSKPAGQWSVLSTGLELDLSLNAILQHVLFVAGVPRVGDVAAGCAGVALSLAPLSVTPSAGGARLANGLQIFPGGVPVYRGATLIGAMGVSGDGVDQDDMIAFLGVAGAGAAGGSTLTNAPAERRADTLTPRDVRLRYVQCPQAPFLDSDEQRPCAGR